MIIRRKGDRKEDGVVKWKLLTGRRMSERESWLDAGRV